MHEHGLGRKDLDQRVWRDIALLVTAIEEIALISFKDGNDPDDAVAWLFVHDEDDRISAYRRLKAQFPPDTTAS
jgi:hypothetical protein